MPKIDNENLIETLDSIIDNIRSLEDAVIKEIEMSKTETESVLKQLATYLNITAQNITELQKSSDKFSSSIDSFNSDIDKIDGIENKVLELPQAGFKIKDEITHSMDKSTKMIAQKFNMLAGYIKKIGGIINNQSAEIERMRVEINTARQMDKKDTEEIIKSQENLLIIIDKMISNKADISKAKIAQGTAQIGAETQKHKATMQLWQKIVAAVAGTGGFLYFLIDIISGIGG